MTTFSLFGLGTLGFLQPLFLIGLVALPLLWWLLRATPPAPTRVAFPAVRVLLGLDDKERTPSRTPWWLLLLRVLAAAALFIAFADPLLNPRARIAGEQPVVIVMDAGWPSAADWPARRATALDLLDQIGEADRPVAFYALTETGAPPERLEFGSAEAAAERIAALEPAPWRPDPSRLLAAVEAAEPGVETLWFVSGLASQTVALDESGEAVGRSGDAAALAEAFAALGPLTLLTPERPPLAIAAPRRDAGALLVEARRAEAGDPAPARAAIFGGGEGSMGDVAARRLAAADGAFEADALSAEIRFEAPIELLNLVERVELLGQPHAGAVALLDARYRQSVVALVAGDAVDGDQALLSGAHYLRAALAPHAAVRRDTLPGALGLPSMDDALSPTLSAADEASVEDAPRASAADVIVLMDVGRIDPGARAALEEWVSAGGLLVRFAGPRLAALADEAALAFSGGGGRVGAPDPLLPVRLRGGGRALGGALSWATPQALRAFDADGPFADLEPSEDVTVARQVLAEPGPDLSQRVWATLADGTPLVTAAPLGDGQVVLFHVTATPLWSNLPLSGLFVDMMERLASAAPRLASAEARLVEDARSWRPTFLLDAYGVVAPAPDDARPATGADLAAAVRFGAQPGLAPGVYQASLQEESVATLAIGAVGPETDIAPRAPAPSGTTIAPLTGADEQPLKPWLIAGALALLLIDLLAAMAIAGRLRRAPGAVAALAVACALGAVAFAPTGARAQSVDDLAEADIVDPAERRAALETLLAYVVTGDRNVDETSAGAMLGLSAVLYAQTSIDPGEAAAVDLERDDLSLYPFLYWPMTARQPDLSPEAIRRLNAFMATGGLLIVDTQDGDRDLGDGAGRNARQLRRLLAGLDLPPLEPLPTDHVLTRSFFLIGEGPGRYDDGEIWVEAGGGGGLEEALRTGADVIVNPNDGVSPIVITSNDWAAAWAIDDRGRPLVPMGRGGERQRELARRFGINLVMYAYTGNYKSDQVHIPELLDRLGE